MNTTVSKRRLTVEEYLAIEETADHKSEFYDGEMFAMFGGNFTHTTIKVNLNGQLYNRLRGGKCRLSDSDMRVLVPATGLHVYPDASVVCGPLQFTNSQQTTLINPNLIVEVLSPSTERYDRTTKFWHYQTIPTFTDYVLVTQDAPQVEHFYRNADGEWLYRPYEGLDAVLKLPAQGIEILLRDIYENITFDPKADPSEGAPLHPSSPSL